MECVDRYHSWHGLRGPFGVVRFYDSLIMPIVFIIGIVKCHWHKGQAILNRDRKQKRMVPAMQNLICLEDVTQHHLKILQSKIISDLPTAAGPNDLEITKIPMFG